MFFREFATDELWQSIISVSVQKNDLEDSDEEEDAGNDDDKRKLLTIHLQLQLVHWQGRREGGMQ